MTILNATITSAAAILAQDTFTADANGEPLGHAGKAMTFPDRQMVMGSRGSLAFTLAWSEILRTIPGADLVAINAAVPDALRRLAGLIPTIGEQAIIHIGWCHDTDSPAGFVYRVENDFAAERIEEGRHIIAPAVLATDDPGYPALYTAGLLASAGEGLGDFHTGLARNQFIASERGLFDGPPLGIGGTLCIHRIDRNGITSTTAPIDGIANPAPMPVLSAATQASLSGWLKNHAMRKAA